MSVCVSDSCIRDCERKQSGLLFFLKTDAPSIPYILIPPHVIYTSYTQTPQDTCLFNDTLLHNIRYGNLKATMAEVEAAAEVRSLVLLLILIFVAAVCLGGCVGGNLRMVA